MSGFHGWFGVGFASAVRGIRCGIRQRSPSLLATGSGAAVRV